MKNHFLKLRINDIDYNKFQQACDNKGKNMSEVIRSFIDLYSNSDSQNNVVLLDIDKESFKNASEICRDKKVKFNDLMKFLLDKAFKNKDKLNILEKNS